MAQKWYQKASVQTAIVSGIFLLVGVAIPYLFMVPKLQDKISNLEKENSDKTAEIQRLETLLAPFRTVALERYTGPESEALQKLADQIHELQEKDVEKTKRIKELQEELAETAKKAKPPILTLISQDVKRDKNGLTCTLRFQSSKNQPLGVLKFIAELLHNSGAKINDFWPTTGGGAFQSGPDSKFISEDKKASRLIYSLMGAGRPTMELKLSEPSIVRISGNFIPEPLIIDVK